MALLVFSVIGFDVAAQIDADQVGHAPDTSMFIRSVTGGVGDWDSLYWYDLHGTAPDSIRDTHFYDTDLTATKSVTHDQDDSTVTIQNSGDWNIGLSSSQWIWSDAGTTDPMLELINTASGNSFIKYRTEGEATSELWQGINGTGDFIVYNPSTATIITRFNSGAPALSWAITGAGNHLWSAYDATPPTGTLFQMLGHATTGAVISVDSADLADFTGVSKDTIVVQEDGTTEIVKLDSLDVEWGIDLTGSVGHAILNIDSSQVATQYDLTQVGGGSVSFGLDNEIPYTNSTTDDFDYSSNFTFDGADLNVDANTLFVDGSTDRIGFFTNAPGWPLHMKLDQNSAGIFRLENDNNGTAVTTQFVFRAGTGANSASAFFGIWPQNYGSVPEWQGRSMFGANSTATGLGISAHNAGQDIRFYTASSSSPKMTLDASGELGIGAGLTDPKHSLHVQENNITTSPIIEIESTGSGDASAMFSVSAASYTYGIDNTDDDKFKISYAASPGASLLGTNDRLSLTAAGQFAFPVYTPGTFDGTDSFIFSGSATGDIQQMNMQEVADSVEAYITFPDAGSLSGNIDTVFHTSSSGLIDTVIVANPEGGNGTDTLNGIFSLENDGATSPGSFDVDIETQFTFEAGLLDLFPAGDLISMYQASQDVKLQVFGDQDIKKASGDGTTMIAFSNNDHTAQPPISFPTAAGGIASIDGIYMYIDSDDDGDFGAFTISADGQTPTTDTPLMTVFESQSTDNEDNGYVRFEGGIRNSQNVTYGGASNQTLDGTNYYWTYNGSTGITVNLPNIPGAEFRIANAGSVSITLDPTSGNINGAATYTLTAGSGVIVYKHPGSDYFAK